MEELTTAQAAELLQVTQRQAARLAAAGHLEISRRAGRTLLLEAESVHRLVQEHRRPGRPWTERIAWAALATLSGDNPTWITAAQRLRLTHRLAGTGPEDLAYLARNRAQVRRFYCHPALIDELAEYIAPSGAFALGAREQRAHGLTNATAALDGYVAADTVAAVIEEFSLLDDPAGPVTLRVVSHEHAFAGGKTPRAAIALDLAASLDTRERSAGLRDLAELLDKMTVQ
ncbi:hypothetical protein [Nocardia goodfellowii]|uniref:Excisionase family DNA binding protein n=1 Tax=Nocardia goodfellowii TaxID=882446 RepID=A0ABS4Q9Y7_9NOCA|nr:hypothetical protein [Nocardia goodfellowii]MBP2188509.1 excisionase family DNA binding protein [Nocardia goodfellowii]